MKMTNLAWFLLSGYVSRLCSFCQQSAVKTSADFVDKSIAKCGHRWLWFCSKNLIEFCCQFAQKLLTFCYQGICIVM